MIKRSCDGKPIQEGVYLHEFGFLVDIRARQDNSFEYRDDFLSHYSLLGEYNKMLLGRISNPRKAANFIEQIAQTLSAEDIRRWNEAVEAVNATSPSIF